MFGTLRGALILSALAHGLLFGALLLLASYLPAPRLTLPPAYTVNLVDLPGAGDAGSRPPAADTRQVQTKRHEPPPEPSKTEKPPEPKAEKPPPPPKSKPEAPKPEMTLPTAKAKEPPKREEKKPEPAARQTLEKAKEVRPQGGKREAERPGAGATGPPGAGSTLALGTGGGMLSLDTANFPFTYYLRQVTNRIEQNWVRPQENVGRVVVYFRIKRDGTIVEPQVHESSRNGAVDLLAAGAVKRSEPFPPLPVEFGGDYLGIYLCFGIGTDCPRQREG